MYAIPSPAHIQLRDIHGQRATIIGCGDDSSNNSSSNNNNCSNNISCNNTTAATAATTTSAATTSRSAGSARKGRKTTRQPADDTSVIHRTVTRMMDPLLDQGYTVYTDQFYTSGPLFKELYNRLVVLSRKTGRVFLKK